MTKLAIPSPAISVVLCTYNGARFLPELLESLAKQTLPVDRIVLRDDGSTDGSEDLVRAWTLARHVELVHVTEPPVRMGPARSFLTALGAGGPAFVHLLADQDDVWLPTKIERAYAALRAAGVSPCLYASRQQLVDASLRPIGTSPRPGPLAFSSAAYESQLTGCTMAFNESLREFACRYTPVHMLMHDWWLYLLASATGRVVFDDMPTILYRQHSHNMVGASPTGLAALWKRLRRAASSPGATRSRQLKEFGDCYADALSLAQMSLIDSLTTPPRSWRQRALIALTVPVQRRGWLNRAGTRLSILRGRF